MEILIPDLPEHVQKNQEETNETSFMEKFPKNQEAQSQNINHGSFSKKYLETKSQGLTHKKLSEDQESNFNISTMENFQKIRNQNFQILLMENLQECQDTTCSTSFHGSLSKNSGNKISKYSWIFFKHVRK